jgi:excisionase family DNA binding protein
VAVVAEVPPMLGVLTGALAPLLTVEDVAAFLHVKPARVYEAVRQRRLRALRVGRLLRFRANDLENFLDRNASP